MGLFVKKPLADLLAEANESGEKTLKRTLGPLSLVALGVGVIIGAGLFSITGTVASGYTGPAITLSFAIAALGCCFAGLCYAEFADREHTSLLDRGVDEYLADPWYGRQLHFQRDYRIPEGFGGIGIRDLGVEVY